MSKGAVAAIAALTALIAVVTVIIGVSLGSKNIPLQDAARIIFLKLTGGNTDAFVKSDVTILWNMRTPRMLLAFAVGGGLAIGGCAMQSMTQNILADPYILGVSSGASVMVSLAFLLFGGKSAINVITPIFAFCGALGAMALVYAIGSWKGKNSTNHLILAGMSVSIILNALSNLFITMLPNAFLMESAAMWMWGSLATARWHNIAIPIIVSLSGAAFFSLWGNYFDLISLGEDTATTLGLDTRRMKRAIILVISVLIGIIISASGLIGFIGFIVPHMVRLLFGSGHRKLFGLSFVTGAVFLAWMDILSRTLLAPREISIGIFAAFFGGPFFIFLLCGKSKLWKD